METTAGYEKAFEFVLGKTESGLGNSELAVVESILCEPLQFRLASLNGVSVPGYENLRWMFLKW